MDIEWNEDPIMRRVPEMKYEIKWQSCPFDSSQDNSHSSNSHRQSCDIPSSNSNCDTQTSECSSSEQEVPLLHTNTKHEETTSSSSPSTLKAESSVDKQGILNDDNAIECSEEVQGIILLESKVESRSDMIVRCDTETETEFMSKVQHTPTKCDETVQADLWSSEAPKDSSTQTSPCSVPMPKGSDIDKILPITNSNSTDIPVNNDIKGNTIDNTSSSIHSLCSQRFDNELQVDHNKSLIKSSCPNLGDHSLVDVTESNQASSSQNKNDECIDDSEYNNIANGSETSKISDETTASICSDSKKSVKDDYVQTDLSMGQLVVLRREVERLQEALKTAESTILWQSLMMRIQNI